MEFVIYLMKFIVIILLNSHCVCCSKNNTYCEISCAIGGKGAHTMCKYPDAKQLGKKCNSFSKPYLNLNSDKEQLLLHHNIARSKIGTGYVGLHKRIQPRAVNVMQLYWNFELERIAERWVQQCSKGSDDCRNTQNSAEVGQNVATFKDTETLDWAKESVYSWYNEGLDFNNSLISSYTVDPKTSQYTQLIWATTTHVGCSVGMNKHNGYREIKLVCNYKPAGNVPGQSVYIIGNKTYNILAPSSEGCPPYSSCSFMYPGLCGNKFLLGDSHIPHRSSSARMYKSYILVALSFYLLVHL